MTPSILKQAREALELAQSMYTRRMGTHEIGEVAAAASSALSALDALDSLSEYDKAVEALAPYLPDGWVAQDESGWTYLHLHGEPKAYARNEDGDGCWAAELDDFCDIESCLNIPKHPDWRDSLRKITRIDGQVVVTKG